MTRRTLFEDLLDGTVATPPTEPVRMSRAKLLVAAGITTRQLTYYVRNGVVSPPIGRTRSATYTDDHLKQVRRVAAELAKGKTVREIAEIYARGSKAQELKRKAAAASRVENVRPATIYAICDGIFVVTYRELLPSETAILKRLLKAGALTPKEQRAVTLEKLQANATEGEPHAKGRG